MNEPKVSEVEQREQPRVAGRQNRGNDRPKPVHLHPVLFDIVHEQRHSDYRDCHQNHIQCADQVRLPLTDSGDCQQPN